MSANAAETDLDLIRRAKTGEEMAFDTLMRRYTQRTYQVIYGLVRNPADAEDLCQETFLRAFENIRSFKEEFRFYTWIYRIAVNLCFTFLKRRKLGPVNMSDRSLGPDADTDDPELPDERLPAVDVQADQRRNIEKALEQLPAEQRTVLVLRTYNDLSYAEIAKTMHTSIGTVMSRLARAREKMRGLLSGYLQGAG